MFRRYWFLENMPDANGFNTHLQRRMERAGLVQRSAPGSVSELMSGDVHEPGEELWFADKGHAPKRTAHYIKRLNQLRDQLIHQESKNLETSLDRFRQQTFQREAVKQSVIRRNKQTGTNHQDKKTERKKKQEKRSLIDTARRGVVSPKVDSGIQGEKMIELSEEAEHRNCQLLQNPEGYIPEDDVYQVISAQAARIRFNNQQRTLRPQQSIPNIHRKSHLPIDPLILSPEAIYQENASPRSETFVKQMSLHHKDQHGLYKGRKRRQLMRADTDELDLYPESFRFDMLLSQAGDSDSEEEGLTGRRYYSGPRVSPVDWNNQPIKFKLSKPKGATTSRSFRPARQGTNASWKTPVVSEQQDASMTKQNLREYQIHVNTHGMTGEGKPSKTCLFCNQPNIGQQLDYILFSRSGTSIVDDRVIPNPPDHHRLYDEDVTTAESLRTGRREQSKNQKEDMESRRKTVKIRMPEVVLTEATEEIDSANDVVTSNSYKGTLEKTAIQSGLRQKEVKALVEDIKDLKQVEKSLKLQMEDQKND